MGKRQMPRPHHFRPHWYLRKMTSLTHPLWIASISTEDVWLCSEWYQSQRLYPKSRRWSGYGQMGITFCPGKYNRHFLSGYWDRDLALDLDAIRDWGAAAVVTLLE